MLPLCKSHIPRLRDHNEVSNINQLEAEHMDHTLRNKAVTESMITRCTFMLNILSSSSFNLFQIHQLDQDQDRQAGGRLTLDLTHLLVKSVMESTRTTWIRFTTASASA